MEEYSAARELFGALWLFAALIALPGTYRWLRKPEDLTFSTYRMPRYSAAACSLLLVAFLWPWLITKTFKEDFEL